MTHYGWHVLNSNGQSQREQSKELVELGNRWVESPVQRPENGQWRITRRGHGGRQAGGAVAMAKARRAMLSMQRAAGSMSLVAVETKEVL